MEITASNRKDKPMLPSPVIDLKTFVPARDPELSKAFYTDLGFTVKAKAK